MINHCRTLLLNKARAENDPSGEFIPKEFSPVALTGALKDVYSVLFEGEASRDVNNRRVRYYMSLLHVPEFRKYLKWYDERLTYEPSTQEGDFDRTGLSEFETIYRNLYSVFSRNNEALRTGRSLDEELRLSLNEDYKRAISDQDRFRVMVYMYLLRLEDVRRG